MGKQDGSRQSISSQHVRRDVRPRPGVTAITNNTPHAARIPQPGALPCDECRPCQTTMTETDAAHGSRRQRAQTGHQRSAMKQGAIAYHVKRQEGTAALDAACGNAAAEAVKVACTASTRPTGPHVGSPDANDIGRPRSPPDRRVPGAQRRQLSKVLWPSKRSRFVIQRVFCSLESLHRGFLKRHLHRHGPSFNFY